MRKLLFAREETSGREREKHTKSKYKTKEKGRKIFNCMQRVERKVSSSLCSHVWWWWKFCLSLLPIIPLLSLLSRFSSKNFFIFISTKKEKEEEKFIFIYEWIECTHMRGNSRLGDKNLSSLCMIKWIKAIKNIYTHRIICIMGE